MALEVVVLAEERAVLRRAQVEHLPRGELLPAGGAGEASEVVDAVAGLAHVVVGQDALAAPGALGTEAPAEEARGSCIAQCSN